MKNLMLAAALAALAAGCGLLKDAGRTANDIAGDLCELHFGENPQQLAALGDKLGKPAISVEEACALHDVVRPFVDQVLSAGTQGAEALGVAQ